MWIVDEANTFQLVQILSFFAFCEGKEKLVHLN